MVTIRLKVKTGLLGGAKVEISVTRPTLPDALAATLWALISRRALTLAEVLTALRTQRAVARAATQKQDRTPGDPLRLGAANFPGFHDLPKVTATIWGLDLAGLRQTLAGYGAALAEALSSAPEVDPAAAQEALAEAVTAGEGAALVDLEAIRQTLERTGKPTRPETPLAAEVDPGGR